MKTGKESSLVSKVMVLAFVLCMAVPAGAILGAAPVAGSDTAVANEAAPTHSRLIRLQYATFDTREVSEPSVQSNLQAQELKAHEKGGFLVQPTNGQVTEEWKAELQLSGADIIGYIPDNALLVRVKGKDVSAVRDLESVAWMGPFHPAYKVSPKLATMDGVARVTINHYGEGTNGPTVRLLRYYDQEIVSMTTTEEANNVIAIVDTTLIDEIASLHDVGYVEIDEPVSLKNLDCSQVLQSGTTTGGRPIHTKGLVGDGYIACVCDSNARPTHETQSPAGKIVANYVSPNSNGILEPAVNDEHGTHVATTVVGDRSDNHIQDGTGDGHAPAASMIFQDIGDASDDTAVFPSGDLYNDHFYLAQFGGLDKTGATQPGGAILHTNSWGGAPGYGAETANIDRYVWDYPNFIICFAAGNDGATAETIDNQGEAKNVICVGATDATGATIASFSSRGPTVPDGRIKPDILAPGMTVTSADGASDTGYVALQGTSMATPSLAGEAILMYEYYDRGFYPTGAEIAGNGFEPSANLIKATMLAGAVDIGTADIPNFTDGWGRLHMENSLFFTGDTRHIQVYDNTFGMIQGQTITYNIGIDDASVPMKVFLVYNDYPGNPASSVMLVNDLDMTMLTPGGTTYYANRFAGGVSTTGIYDEELNNVRAFHFTAPAVGVYTITITASNVPYGPQPFALVVNGGINPGYGTMQINKGTYGPGDYIDIQVEDLNNPASTITATVTTSVGLDSETVTLTATGVNSGIFRGSLLTKVGNIVLNDARLEVVHGETITVRYGDTNPAHNADATAKVDIAGPVISGVWFSDTSATATIVHWTTNENADSKLLFYKEGDEGNWQTRYNDDLVIKHDRPLTGLLPGEVYYIDISSTDISGVETIDDNGGFHYKITTLSATAGVMVLYVDDDDGTSSEIAGCGFEEDWKNNFKAYGWSYTHWDYKKLGTPTLTDMNAHKIVVWVVNEGYPQLDATNTATLQSFVNQNDRVPRIYIAGQDIGWDLGPDGTVPNTAFLANYLRGTYIIDDASYGTQGVEEDPFQVDDCGHAMNSVWALTDLDLEVDAYDPAPYDFDRFWPDDMANVNGGVTAMQYSNVGTSDSAVIAYSGPNYGGGTYNMVYSCFAPDMISATNVGATDYAPPAVDAERAKFLDEIIIYLLGGDHADINLVTPVGGESLTGIKNVQWTVAGGPDWINVFVSSNGGGEWALAAGGNLTGTATSYNLNTALYPDGAKYQIKVVGITQVPGVILTGEDKSGNVTFNNGVDTVGPLLSAGTLAISPNPTYGTNGALAATFNDVMFGNSPITNAQYRLDGGAWVAMTAGAGTTTRSFTATVTCPVAIGEHTIEAQARDDHLNWGPIYDLTWYRYTVTTNPSPDPPTNPSPADDATGVSTSPTLSVTVVDPNAQTMTVRFYNAANDALIGTANNVASGGTASTTWSGLSDTTVYSWYATATDSEWTTGSAEWTFTTGDFTAPAAPGALNVDHYGPGGFMAPTTEARYLRGVVNEATVNGLTAYSVGLTNSATAGNYAVGNNAQVHLGMRVYKRSSAGVETEISGGSLVATVSRTSTGSGFQTATWTPTLTTFATTDSIVLKVYGGTTANPTTVRATFTTGQLGATQLDANQWTVQYWTRMAGTSQGGSDWYWGTDTYANLITGFKWSTYTPGNPLWHNTLNWTASTSPDTDHYNVYRSASSTGPWTTLAGTAPFGTNTFVDMDMGQADSTYWWYVVRAEDGSGNEDTNTASVQEPIVGGNLPPVANAGVDQSGTNPYLCTFNGAGSSDPDGSIILYQWTFVYNAATQTLTGVSPTFNFAISGVYTVTLTVTDDGSPAAQDTDTMTVTVNSLPIANAGPDQVGILDYLCTFNGAGSSDPDGSIASYTWTFTYNSLPQTRTGVNPTFNFLIAGVYTVTLTVTDNLGATDDDTMTVTVNYLTHNVAFTAGWNMLSFAVNTEGGKPLATVFANEWSNIQTIMYYDALTGDWKQYDKSAPSYMNDLKFADESKGYWVKFIAAGDGILAVQGKALTTTTVTLRAGWNLVGVPDNANVVANTALAGTGFDLLMKYSAVQTYLIASMAGTENMVPGSAYWVHVPAATSYVVTY